MPQKVKNRTGCNCCGVSLTATVVFDGVRVCTSCLLPGATVTVTQATLGFTGSGTTDVNGDCTIALPCNDSVTFSYSITHPDFTTKAGTFILQDFGTVCTRTVTGANVTLADTPGRFCTIEPPSGLCIDPLPASLFVTLPTLAHLGSLSGTTVTVPFSASPPPSGVGDLLYRGCYAATGACLAGVGGVGVEVRFTNARICGTPTGSVTIYPNTAASPTCITYPGTGSHYADINTSGSVACPVAFTTTGSFTFGGGGCPNPTITGLHCTVSE